MTAAPINVFADTPAAVIQNALSGYDQAIARAQQLGILVGDANGDFHAEATLTRQEAATILVRMFKLDHPAATASSFKDVAVTSWASSYIEAVHKAGLMSGAQGSFRPKDTLTREELLATIVRGLKLDMTGKGANLTVKDAASIQPWARDYIQTAIEQGLVVTEDGSFHPEKALTRQETAQYAVFAVTDELPKLQSIGTESIVVNGLTYKFADSLKPLFTKANKAILANAGIRFTVDKDVITKVTQLNIVAGGQAPKEGEAEFSGNAVLDGTGLTVGAVKVSADFVTIKNLKVEGDFEISVSVEHDFYGLNLDIAGTTNVLGGDSNTVVFDNGKLNGLFINKKGVHVALKGSTIATGITMKANGNLSSDHGLPGINVESGVSSLKLDGSSTGVTYSGDGDLEIGGEGKLDELSTTGSPSITFTGKRSIGKVKVGKQGTVLNFQPGSSINNIELPDGVTPQNVIPNYGSTIGQASYVNGVPTFTMATPSTSTTKQSKYVVNRGALYEEMMKFARVMESYDTLLNVEVGESDKLEAHVRALVESIDAIYNIFFDLDATSSELKTAQKNMRTALNAYMSVEGVTKDMLASIKEDAQLKVAGIKEAEVAQGTKPTEAGQYPYGASNALASVLNSAQVLLDDQAEPTSDALRSMVWNVLDALAVAQNKMKVEELPYISEMHEFADEERQKLTEVAVQYPGYTNSFVNAELDKFAGYVDELAEADLDLADIQAASLLRLYVMMLDYQIEASTIYYVADKGTAEIATNLPEIMSDVLYSETTNALDVLQPFLGKLDYIQMMSQIENAAEDLSTSYEQLDHAARYVVARGELYVEMLKGIDYTSYFGYDLAAILEGGEADEPTANEASMIEALMTAASTMSDLDASLTELVQARKDFAAATDVYLASEPVSDEILLQAIGDATDTYNAALNNEAAEGEARNVGQYAYGSAATLEQVITEASAVLGTDASETTLRGLLKSVVDTNFTIKNTKAVDKETVTSLEESITSIEGYLTSNADHTSDAALEAISTLKDFVSAANAMSQFDYNGAGVFELFDQMYVNILLYVHTMVDTETYEIEQRLEALLTSNPSYETAPLYVALKEELDILKPMIDDLDYGKMPEFMAQVEVVEEAAQAFWTSIGPQ
nr:S-layer homology domain-containing protein [Paenibacillus phyllosphaerae]